MISQAHLFTLNDQTTESLLNLSSHLAQPSQPDIFSNHKHLWNSPQITLEQQYQKYLQLIPFMIQWKIAMLSTRLFQPQPLILLQISHISFTQLKMLDLSTNNIHNLEALAFLDCAKLAYLSLSENKITSLKPIAKSLFESLRSFNIGGNLLSHKDLQHLTKHFISINLHDLKLSIESYYQNKRTTEYSCINEIFKFKPKEIKDCTLENTFLVDNFKLYQKLNNHKLHPMNNISLFRIKQASVQNINI